MRAARQTLGEYLGTAADNLVYTTNVTVALNIVARSLELGPGDEVLSSDHEYGALDRTWRFLAQERGFRYINHPVPLPLTTPEAFVEVFWSGVTPRTRVIFLSHITSPTALIFPVAQVCARARREGILTVIDGAHAPGQIPLRLDELGADFYGGNLHKWLCAPKGAGFLYARPEVQPRLKPLIVSWGYQAETPGPSRFIDEQEWTGTRDIAAFLAVAEAIRFQEEHDWGQVRAACHELLRETVGRICALSAGAPLADDSWYAQMAAAPLPDSADLATLKAHLYEKDRIEVPFLQWQERKLMRVSIQGYNTRRDVEKLLRALERSLRA
jgi:isopenicillin-N epimerase